MVWWLCLTVALKSKCSGCRLLTPLSLRLRGCRLNPDSGSNLWPCIFRLVGSVSVVCGEVVDSWCFRPSQPQRIISGLRETLIKRDIVKRTSKAEIRLEEQSEKVESCRENSWNEIQLKGPSRQKQTQEEKEEVTFETVNETCHFYLFQTRYLTLEMTPPLFQLLHKDTNEQKQHQRNNNSARRINQ